MGVHACDSLSSHTCMCEESTLVVDHNSPRLRAEASSHTVPLGSLPEPRLPRLAFTLDRLLLILRACVCGGCVWEG